MSETATAATVAVIGGTGFYSFLSEPDRVSLSTPYGDTSDAITVGEVDGRTVAFLPRHGPHHEYPPHRINYRANMWALRSLGVRQVLAPCAAGSLVPGTEPGTVVVPDQLVDRTTSRTQTYMDSGAAHAPFADPYCPVLRRHLVGADPQIRDGGTMVVVEGPRFSTRAESQGYAASGWSLINMTGHPEAVLARELGLCYATVAVVTDVDAGASAEEAVDQAQVFATFGATTDRLKRLLLEVICQLPMPVECACDAWLAEVTLPFELP